jgi:hypothetical protein
MASAKTDTRIIHIFGAIFTLLGIVGTILMVYEPVIKSYI